MRMVKMRVNVLMVKWLKKKDDTPPLPKPLLQNEKNGDR